MKLLHSAPVYDSFLAVYRVNNIIIFCDSKNIRQICYIFANAVINLE